MTQRAFTDAQAEELRELYAAGFTVPQLAAYFSVAEETVRSQFARSNIALHASRKLTPDQVEDAIFLYKEGVSTLVLGKHFGVSPQTVSNIFQGQGVALRKAGGRRHLALREDVFDVLTPESAYWLGFLATDGCVTGYHGENDMVKLALKMDDADHVYLFRTFLGSEHAVGLSVGKHPTDAEREVGMAQFQVRSRRLVEALAKYGIGPRKTHTLVAKGGVEKSRDYWRGVVDGDGHIGIHKSNQGDDACLKLTSASEPFAVQFRDFLKDNGVRGNHGIIAERPAHHSLAGRYKYIVRLGVRAALDAVALLYTDGCPVLARKENAAKTMIRRGINRELVGTLVSFAGDGWYDSRAAAWAGVPAH